jgi:hypothetical protein
MTAVSSLFDVNPAYRAESATATPWAKGSMRAKSITVLGTEVSGTPR